MNPSLIIPSVRVTGSKSIFRQESYIIVVIIREGRTSVRRVKKEKREKRNLFGRRDGRSAGPGPPGRGPGHWHCFVLRCASVRHIAGGLEKGWRVLEFKY